jgi:phosphate uptake regulator
MGLFDFWQGQAPPLVKQASEDVQDMLEHGHHMFSASTAFVLDNEILDVDLSALDEKINESEQHLRRSVLEHLTIDPQRELVFSLKLLSIVHEAERIGDLAKSLEKTGRLAKKPRMGELVQPLRDMRDRILRMFDYAREGFVESEEDAARTLMIEHEQMKDDVTAYLNNLSDRDGITSNEAIVYAMSARLMSRVSSHLSNIASAVASPFDQIRRAPTWKEEEKSA